ncbi:hypothetical protein PRIPAC_97069 [Pristionchus pacificus]|uniref:Cytochrome P450 n=1 Tax=Pristionchus pacificus TaxID=54126 RepID=A0A2A6D1N3_PRIPA|nr:hypothetical protein PRIPAC_97069 [Pristionchus pacificus]|eukprot:PDM84288.1 cytochrome P450 [Pristionchus pacificus]
MAALFYLPWLITTISKFLYQYPYVRKLPAPLKFFSEEAAKARARGDGIFTMTVFGRVMTFPLNGDAVKAICESTEEITKGKDYDFLHPWMGNGIVFAIGQRWRDLRKSYTPIFHSRTMLEELQLVEYNGDNYLDDALSKRVLSLYTNVSSANTPKRWNISNCSSTSTLRCN